MDKHGFSGSMPMRLSSEERGAAAIFVAVSMILMLGMAALAIDLGAGFNERRQDQTSSDLAAVAGALSFGDNDAVADQVMAAARTNVDTEYLDADWVAAWTNCTDADMPAGFTPITHSTLGVIDCISLNPSFVRVRLPDQLVATTFGRILGVNTLTTSAGTIVTLLADGGAGSLPFAVRGDASSGYICLDTSTGSKIVPPCDGNEQGSFGNIAPPLFGNPYLGTSPACNFGIQTSNNNYVPESIAMGIDHTIWTFSQAQWDDTPFDPDDKNLPKVDDYVNKDQCTNVGGAIPAKAADGVPINAVWVDTGNSTRKQITEGLITGTSFADGSDARLTRSSSTRRVDGYDLDNVPLWQHLGQAVGGSSPEDNHGIAACDGPTVRAISDIEAKSNAMQACLTGYGSSTSQIFSDTILNSPRLGITPRIWTNNLGSGQSLRPVKAFDIVYIHAIWFDDKAETVFYAGEGSGNITLGKWKAIEQVTAYLLVDDMVSQLVRTSIGGMTDGSFQPTIFE